MRKNKDGYHDWEHILACARFLAGWFVVHEAKEERDGDPIFQWNKDKEQLSWSITQYFPPEALDENWSGPGWETDRYVLAVWLFQLIFGCHPISWNEESPGTVSEWYLTCKEPGAFRFAEGRKKPETFLYSHAAARWDAVPSWFRDAFYQTFTEGINDPGKRISAGDWLAMIEELIRRRNRKEGELWLFRKIS